MVKLISYQKQVPNDDGTIVATVYADAKADVTSSVIEELKLATGSIVYTKALDIGVIDSDGTVNWTE